MLILNISPRKIKHFSGIRDIVIKRERFEESGLLVYSVSHSTDLEGWIRLRSEQDISIPNFSLWAKKERNTQEFQIAIVGISKISNKNPCLKRADFSLFQVSFVFLAQHFRS